MFCLKQKILCGIAALCTVLSVQAEDKIMRVGAEPAYAPFEFIDEETKELTGFDIELIKAIAEVEGYKIEISTMPFDALIPALLTNNVDVILSAITITEERKKRVAFSVPYYDSGLTILINEKDKDKVFLDIVSKKPDIVLVALGIPLQEKLIYKYLDKFEKGIFVGVGGSFDVISGHKKRAPKVFIKLNLEWLYRIMKEPSRLKRFYDSNVKFIFKVRKYK